MPLNRATRTCLAGASIAVLLADGPVPAAAGAGTRQETAAPDRDARLVAEFNRRLQQYVDIHTKADSSLSEFPKSASKEQVDEHQRSLGQLIGRARGNASQGDIFTRDIRAFFRRQIHRALAGPDGPEIRATIMEENPGAIKLQVNGKYPDTLPVSTMPPQVLALLPRLPKELEYRFIGRRLVLLDVHAQLIVDYVDDAIPR